MLATRTSRDSRGIRWTGLNVIPTRMTHLVASMLSAEILESTGFTAIIITKELFLITRNEFRGLATATRHVCLNITRLARPVMTQLLANVFPAIKRLKAYFLATETGKRFFRVDGITTKNHASLSAMTRLHYRRLTSRTRTRMT